MPDIKTLVLLLEKGFAKGEVDLEVFEELKAASSALAQGKPAAAAGPPLKPGVKLDCFEVKKLLGQGGWASVYLAFDEENGRDLALKVLTGSPEQLGVAFEMLAYEREQCRVLEGSPHVRGCFAPRRIASGGLDAVVIPLELGVKSLRDWFDERPEPGSAYYEEWLSNSLMLFDQVCHGLQAVHAAGLAHLDMKPENVLICDVDSTPVAKVADLGQARAKWEFLQPGRAPGSPAYMSPEQFDVRPKDLGPEADVYAMGCMLFEMLDGAPPFVGDTADQWRRAHLELHPPMRRWDGHAVKFKALVEAALRKRPEDRPQDGDALLRLWAKDYTPVVPVAKPAAEVAAPPPGAPPPKSGSKTAADAKPMTLEERFAKPFTLAVVGMEFVPIKPGSFKMGDDSFGPVHQVTLTRPFWMASSQVAQDQYEALGGSNPSHFASPKSKAPVEQVTWNKAMDFCSALTEIEREKGQLPEGYVFRLPTEAEWEYCCRAGSAASYCFGESLGQLGDYAWFNTNSNKMTRAVGKKKANAWGLFDMHGNVWEWCLDFFVPYEEGDVSDPSGPATGATRVYRGGSWRLSGNYCKSAYRSGAMPTATYDNVGFRVVCGPA